MNAINEVERQQDWDLKMWINDWYDKGTQKDEYFYIGVKVGLWTTTTTRRTKYLVI